MTYDLQVFGRFRLLAPGGAEIELASKKGQALLAVLALAGGQGVTRERLTGLLWADRGEEQARSSLRQALTAIRKALQGNGGGDGLLRADDGEVGLDGSLCSSDVARLKALTDAGDASSLVEALKLLEAELLDGLGLRDEAIEDWLSGERRQLRALKAEVLKRLANIHDDAGKPDEAIAAARRLADIDPLNEEAHRLLMRLLAAKGDRVVALQQYKTCAEALKAELGIAPDAETQRLYEEIRGAAKEAPAAPATAARPVAKLAIAVLPFTAPAGEVREERVADTLTRELITELGRFPLLAVAGAVSAFAFKGRAANLTDLRRELGARFIVEGSLEFAGSKVRVTAQLTDAESSEQVWAKRYDVEAGDGFQFRDAIVTGIAGNLYRPLLDYAVRLSLQQPPDSESVAELYARLYHEINYPEQATQARARELCQRIIAADPGFALVYEGLSWTYLHDAIAAWTDDPDEALQLAREAAARGIALDQKEPYNRIAMGFVEAYQGRHRHAMEEIRTALALNPHDGVVSSLAAGGLTLLGHCEEALDLLEKAKQQSPDFLVIPIFEGLAQFHAGRPGEAVHAYENFLKQDPENEWVEVMMVACYAELGDLAAAERLVKHLVARGCRLTCTYLANFYRHIDPKVLERMLAGLRKAGMPEGKPPALSGDGTVGSRPPPKEAPSAAAAKPASKLAIAVLPFAATGDEPREERFADALTRELITELGHFSPLEVAGALSSFALKDRKASLAEVKGELGARFVVEGTVEFGGAKVRVTAQLSDVETSRQIWAHRYDVDVGEGFQFRDEIVAGIAGNLYGPLMEHALRETLYQPPGKESSADLYTRLFHDSNYPSIATQAQMRELCFKLIAIDPGHALVYESLAWSYLHDTMNAWTDDPGEALRLAREAAARGIALDQNEPYVRVAMGHVESLQGRKRHALEGFRAALAISPNDGIIAALVADGLAWLGHHDEALKLVETARRQSPDYNLIPYAEGFAHFFAGRPQEAAHAFEQFLITNPDYDLIEAHLAVCQVEAGDPAAARQVIERLSNRNSRLTRTHIANLYATFDAGFLRRMLSGLKLAGMAEGAPLALPAGTSSATGEQPVIAVMPFANMSGDGEQQYFSDGITGDLIAGLSRFRSLAVIAPSSSFPLREKNLYSDEIGEALGADFIVEGSVRRAGARVRITAQLIEAASGKHLWAERYDRDLEDIFAVQDEVVDAIAASVPGVIGREAIDTAMAKPADSLTAYDHLLRAERAWRQDAETATVRRLYEQVIEIDPACARAHSRLGSIWMRMVFTEGISKQEAWEKSRLHTDTALALDDRNPATHGAAAVTYIVLGQYDLARTHIERAMALNPNDIEVMQAAGCVLSYLGHPHDGLAWLERARRFDPAAPDWLMEAEFEAWFNLGEFAKAIDAVKTWRRRRTFFHAELAAAYAHLGRMDEARAHRERHERERPPGFDFPQAAVVCARMCALPEVQELWLDGYRKAGFEV